MVCIKCGDLFSLPVVRTRGRPRQKCFTCNPGLVCHNNTKPKANRSYGKDRKRTQNKDDIGAYREFLGSKHLPSNESFWFLAGPQNTDNSFVSLITEDMKLCSPQQLWGVDRDFNIIEQNKEAYPLSNWIEGEFTDQIELMKFSNVRIVWYDGLDGIDKESKFISKLVQRLPIGCLLAVNIWAERSGNGTKHRPSHTLKAINSIEGISNWNRYKAQSFGDSWFSDYQSDLTPMDRYRTFLLVRSK